MVSRFGFVAVCLFASLLLAKPGVVVTLEGDRFNGDITENDKFVIIDLHGVKTQIDKRNVSTIQYTKTAEDEFNERKAKLGDNDIKGRIDLSNWALQNNRPDLAVQILEEARKIDPMNQDAARALMGAQQQLDMSKSAPADTGAPAATAATKPVPQAAVTPTPAGKPPAVHRLLNNDEVNIIRQQEITPDDKVRVQFSNDVIKTYLSSGDHDANAFHRLTPTQQAIEIVTNSDAKTAANVHILTDPPPLVQFKQKIFPIIAAGCGSSGCHGGTHAGTFGLYTGDSVNAIYSNFFIMMTYAKTIEGKKYLMMDRTLPDRSLFIQYDLPATMADVAHANVPNYRPRIRSKDDLPYTTVIDWLTNSLKPIPPDYHIDVSPKLPEPAGKVGANP